MEDLCASSGETERPRTIRSGPLVCGGGGLSISRLTSLLGSGFERRCTRPDPSLETRCELRLSDKNVPLLAGSRMNLAVAG